MQQMGLSSQRGEALAHDGFVMPGDLTGWAGVEPRVSSGFEV